MKALYLADRDLLDGYGRTITGDRHVSMPRGPVLSGAYNLCNNRHHDIQKQAEWNTAFARNGDAVVELATVDTEVLSPVEIEILKTRAKEVVDVMGTRNLANWIHQKCPEWVDVSQCEKKSAPLSVKTILEKGLKRSASDAEQMALGEARAVTLREKSKQTAKPLVSGCAA